MGLKFRTHGTELYCEYVDPSICYGGGQSSGSSQSSGYGSSYNQSASLSLPIEMNPTTGSLGGTEAALQAIQAMIGGSPSNNSLLQSFLAPYGGNMAAPITAAQQGTLNNIGAAEGGNFGSFDPTLQAVYNQLVGEATNPVGYAQQVASGLAGPGAPVVGEGQFASNLATGGAIQKVIQQAEAPITTAFNTQTVPGVIGNAVQAGQRATGSGSSAFDAAFANAASQEQANLGSTAANITNNAYNEGISSYAGMYGSGLNIAANAPSQIGALTSNEVNQLIATLNAQALPQLTEQQGINNALSTYNGSVSSILQALGLQIQGEQPAIGYESQSASNSASFQNEQSSGQQQSFQFQV